MATLALLTDFGLRDHYVGVLHLILNREAPGVPRIDICHEIPAGDLRAASFFIRECWPLLSEGTVLLAVVDPGVGSSRRAVAARLGGRFIVGPDNGILSAAAQIDDAFELKTEGASSRTFHGRDIFAPAAGRLARGESPESLGNRIDPLSLRQSPLPDARKTEWGFSGEVLHIDRFGNLITNIPFSREITDIQWEGGGTPRAVSCYQEAPEGAVCFLRSSSIFVEIAVGGRSASSITGLKVGDTIRAREKSPLCNAAEDLRIDP